MLGQGISTNVQQALSTIVTMFLFSMPLLLVLTLTGITRAQEPPLPPDALRRVKSFFEARTWSHYMEQNCPSTTYPGWLVRQTAEKVQLALEECWGATLPTAVTYYLEANESAQLFEWIDSHPLSGKYALISHYPNTTPGHKIDPAAIFSQFARKFPETTTLGWGEYGTQDEKGKNTAQMRERAALIRKVEQCWWGLIAPVVSNSAGFGGYRDWGTDRQRVE